MRDLLIRRWREDDSVFELTDLLHRAYKRLLDAGFHYAATTQNSSQTMDRIRLGECYVAVKESAVVGTILLMLPGRRAVCEWYDRDDVARFGQFAVDPKDQGHKIGLTLLAHVEQRAVELGYRYLACDTAEEASGLIRYYEKLGYSPVDRVQWPRANYRSVVLNKKLSDRA